VSFVSLPKCFKTSFEIAGLPFSLSQTNDLPNFLFYGRRGVFLVEFLSSVDSSNIHAATSTAVDAIVFILLLYFRRENNHVGIERSALKLSASEPFTPHILH